MPQQGTTAEYVYAEIQTVCAVGAAANDPLVGQPVVAVRMNLGAEAPSRVLILDVGNAIDLCNDLARVLREHFAADCDINEEAP